MQQTTQADAPQGEVAGAETPKSVAQQQLQAIFAPVTTYSRATRLAKALISPTARVWHRAGQPVRIGEEAPDGTKEIYGEGETFAAAFLSATHDLAPEEVVKLAGSTLKSIHSANARRPRLLSV